MSDTIFPPWEPDTVYALNLYQHAGVMHPFTCGRDDCREILQATTDGWVCPSESCDYWQTWAYAFMGDRGSVERMIEHAWWLRTADAWGSDQPS